jgi:ornithine carbamoyltransferase
MIVTSILKPRLLVAGECYAKNIIDVLKKHSNTTSDFFEVINISYGDGRIDHILDTLDIFEYQDNDIFVIGGCTHEYGSSKDGFQKKLEKLITKIFNKYKNSKIVFWNIAPCIDHPYYQYILDVIKVKESFANNKNIFALSYVGSPTDYRDKTHLINAVVDSFMKEVVLFFETNVEKLCYSQYKFVKPEQIMSFTENEAVVFILEYKEEIPSEILVEYLDGKISTFNHHPSINVIKNRKNIFKLKQLKCVLFADNIVPLHCLIQCYS